MDPFIAEIVLFGGNFAPRSWAYCDGQLLAISSHSALFSLLGTTYGGDGRTSFGLPDLRGRTAIGPRNGPGLSDYRLGQKGGVEHVTLNTTQIPSHNHQAVVRVSSNDPNVMAPDGHYLAEQGGPAYYSGTPDANSSLGGVIIGNTGGNLSHENRQPFLALNYIIAMEGVFPSRS